MSTRGWPLCGVAFAALAVASIAHAQEQLSSPDKADTPTQADPQIGFGDIVVTANKREQNFSKVGLSITALGAESLRNQGIADVSDLAKVTPGLIFAPTPNATPVYTLRGVGFNESTLAAYPNVSLYIDQTPLPLPIMSSRTSFDLERVEVLKGPQGTLFGNNATGGAINFVAAKPTSEFHAGVTLGYARFNTFDVNAFVSGPITDTLSARLALKSVNGDAWQRAYTRKDSLGRADNIAGRFLLDWKPVDALHFQLNLNAWRDQGEPQAPQLIGFSAQNPVGSSGFYGTVPADLPILNYPLPPTKSARAADWTPTNRPQQDNRFKQAALRIDADIADDVAMTSLTSYDDFKYNVRLEADGTSLYGVDIESGTAPVKSFNQELRIAGSPNKPFRWVVGANYERTTVDEFTAIRYEDTTSTVVNNIATNAYYSNQKMRNYAFFGNLEYDFNEEITLKGGIRQTYAKRSTVSGSRDDARFPPPAPTMPITLLLNQVYGAVYGGAVAPIVVGQPYPLDTRVNANGTPVDPQTYLKTGNFIDTLSEHNTSWSAGVDYKPSSTALFYANISKGYKAGSYPEVAGVIFSAYEPVTQESLLAYEAGFKLQLFDRRVSFNGAAFYYDYRDKQLRTKFVDPIFGLLDRLFNVPKSRVQGLELGLTANPVRGLTVAGAGTYLDAKVKRYQGTVGSALDSNGLRVPVEASFAGVDLPFAPEWQFNMRVDYDFPISSTLSAFVGSTLTGQSRSIGILTVNPADRDIYRINGRILVDANVGIRSSDDQWRLNFWAKNILNKYYWTNTTQQYDTILRYTGRPAEYGVTLGWRM